MYNPRVGDIAFIRNGSEYYGISPSNPANTPGIIISFHPETYSPTHTTEVYWYLNKCENDYRPKDLWIIPQELC